MNLDDKLNIFKTHITNLFPGGGKGSGVATIIQVGEGALRALGFRRGH